MKKIVFITVLGLFISANSAAQLNADQLIRVNNVANINSMNAINSPNEGNLVYVESDDNLYIRKGNNWSTIWTNRGNSATNTCFIGPTSNHDFNIKTYNTLREKITSSGDVFINHLEVDDLEFAVGKPNNQTTALSSSITATASIGSWGAPNLSDNNNSTSWAPTGNFTTSMPQWCKHDYGGSTRVVTKYRIETSSVYNTGTTGPRSWTFEGSNDNSNWTILDTKTNVYYTYSYETEIENLDAYRYYRLHCTYYRQNGNSIQIQNLKLYGQIFETDDSRLVIKNNGFVGIGLQNPTQKLHVDGNIIASGTITPDYVFENYFEGKSERNPEYEFTPIQKAEHFVKKNKHSPGVPSAADIEKQGGIIINRATEINLEKIEEVYLYIFELNDRIDKLEEELSKCKRPK